MNKEKYLKELEKRLKFLSDAEKQEEIFRVSNLLDNEEIVKDIHAEVQDIYKKYKIDEEKERKKEKNKMIHLLNEFSQKCSRFTQTMKKNDYKKNLVIIRDILLILLITFILKIPFIGVETLLFSLFGQILSDFVFTIFHILIEILYLLFAIYFFLHIFSKRFKKEME